MKRTASGGYTLGVQAGLATKTVAADASCSRCPSRSCALGRPLEVGLLPAQAAGDRRARHGDELEAPRAVHAPPLDGPRLRTARRTPTAATRTRGRSRARSPGSPGSSSTTRAARSARASAPGRRPSRAQQFLAQIEPVLPGLSQYWNGKATVDYWTGYPWTLGSYSYWKVGQYTAFSGIEGRQEGNAHFCGEHTSIDFQGYLNGAVDTGQRAAGEVIADLR